MTRLRNCSEPSHFSRCWHKQQNVKAILNWLWRAEACLRTPLCYCSEPFLFATLHVLGRVCLVQRELLVQKLLNYGFQTLWGPDPAEASLRTSLCYFSEPSLFATLHVFGRVCLVHRESLVQKLLLNYGFQTLWGPEPAEASLRAPLCY